MRLFRPTQAEQDNSRTEYVLGPYDAALHEPLRLRLTLADAPDASPPGWQQQISQAQVELGYNRVGLEERVSWGGLNWIDTLSLVEGICGRCSQANTLAYVQAAEAMARIIVPARGAYLRLVALEAERIASHLLNAADIMSALELTERETLLRDLRERVVQAMSEWTGVRANPGLIVYGGVSKDLDEEAARALAIAMRHVERALRAQVNTVINNREIAARLAGLAVINARMVQSSGLRGPIARAAAIPSDLRVTFPTGAYEDEAVTIVVQRNGDAYARLAVRLLECLESFRVVEQALDDLPPGPVVVRLPDTVTGSGMSRVEGPRGEIFCWIDAGEGGPRGLHLSAGSFPTLGVLNAVLAGQRLEDLRLVLLSLDLCLACAER